MRRLPLFALALFAAVPLAAGAQGKPDSLKTRPDSTAKADSLTFGRVTGRIIDAATGAPIPNAFIQVVGIDTTKGRSAMVQSAIDGRYLLKRVPTGPLTLQVRAFGRGAVQITGLYLKDGDIVEQDVTMQASPTQELAAMTVEAVKESGTAAAALDQQRTSTNIVNSVTAEQISRSPDANAAQAIQRVSGVTTQDGKFVFVRGLGERYTTTSLNDTRVPSAEPEKRVVPLDMFPAGLLQSITTLKTFTPDQPGDFAGAVVNIKTREFPAHRTGSLSLGSGYAAGATGTSLLSATGAGGEAFGVVSHDRALPDAVRAAGNFQHANFTQADYNHMIASFRDSWTPKARTAAPLINGSASIGGNDPILFGHRVGYLVAGTLSSGTDTKDGQVRALTLPGSTKGETMEEDRFEGNTVSQGVLWGGLATMSTLIGSNNRIMFNALYNRSADNDARVEDGTFTGDGIAVRLTRMQYVQRGLYSAGLSGEHQIGTSQRFEWKATRSGVRRYEPDRSEFVQVLEGGVYRWLTGGSGGAVRTFSNLNEHSSEVGGSYEIMLSQKAAAPTIKLGGLYRAVSRDAESFSYVISARNADNDIRELSPEQIFDGRFTTDASDLFTLGPLSQGGSYSARDHLRAGFVMADVPIGASMRLVGGARYESDHLNVDAVSTLGSPVTPRKTWNDLLPSVALNIHLTDRQQLRVSASRTLARPEYREITPIISRDVIGGENVQGDENLTRTNVTNADVRWEMYPRAGEIIGLAVFAKHFNNPIERVFGSGSGGTSYVFYTNADAADNYGVELEVRKYLGTLSQRLMPWAVFGNATVMQSQIHLRDGTQAATTNLDRRMVGQAPYVINTGLSYTSDNDLFSGTLLYNRVGPRITAAGGIPLPDVVDEARNVLDLSLRFGVSAAITARFDAKNLLDSPYAIHQGSVTREFYRAGRMVQAGVTWRP